MKSIVEKTYTNEKGTHMLFVESVLIDGHVTTFKPVLISASLKAQIDKRLKKGEETTVFARVSED